MDILDKFTKHLRNVMRDAARLAEELHHERLGPLHLLYGLARQQGSIGSELLVKSGLTAEVIEEHLRKQTEAPAPGVEEKRVEPSLGTAARHAIEKAVLLANQYEHRYVGTEHLLLGILRLRDERVQTLLQRHHVNEHELHQHLAVVLRNTSRLPDITNVFDQQQEGGEELQMLQPQEQGTRGQRQGSALEYFCTELTDAKFQETIDPVIGREREIERMIQILSRRTKNNPVLIGDPGVGKTAIVEGLAKRIVEGTVPEILIPKRLYSLDLSLVVAGTVYRGEFESRIKQIIEEVQADTNIILFIDELHTIIGAGGASGALDAANILKPALAKGYLRCIGATTLEEYHKHIESDAALERRFQPILVNEPTRDETVEVLRGIKERYEQYHRVAISDEALQSATDLSIRYLQDKHLPDKAIDLIDEAASRLKIGTVRDSVSKEIRGYEQRLAELQKKKHEAVQREDFTFALAVKDEELTLRKQLSERKKEQAQKNDVLLGPITAADVATIVAHITGIPVGDMLKGEQRKLLNLEARLKKHIVGQDEALHAIASSIRRSRTGIASPDRPLGSFIFLGPSGVGKTETAKVLAREVFGDEQALIQLDMSEFSESFQTSKLIGAPAGYVGYKDGGKLTEGVKRRPYAVVLFDEIEKAHPDVFNLLLQILDEGHITDAVGKKINFKNTIVILTSNIGLKELNEQAAIGFEGIADGQDQQHAYAAIEEKVLEELRNQFRPELLNRIDRTIVFRPLGRRQVTSIVQLQLREIAQRLGKQGIFLEYDKELARFLTEKGSTNDQGARGIRSVIQAEVEDMLADYLLRSNDPEHRLRVGVRRDSVTISKR